MIGRSTLVAITVALLVPGAALAADPVFTAPLKLPQSKPEGPLAGGEPSVAYDPTGDGHVYADAPGGPQGVSFWASRDGGDTWPIAKPLGSQAGGGDTDVEVGGDHTIYVPDLEIAANAICRSHDFGATFTDGCSEGDGAATDQTGPESDRPWMAHDPRDPKVVYFVYHDLAGGTLLAERSDDGGSTWGPCGNLLEPGNEAQLNFSPTGGTGLGKPAIGPDGTVYVPFILPSSRNALAPYDRFYMAVARGGCNATTQWQDFTVHSNPGADLSHFWPNAAVDTAGTVYAATAGLASADDKGYSMYLWVSRDGGKSWSKQIRVNTPDLRSNVLPALTGGTAPGRVGVGWYGTPTTATATDPANHWRYYAAESWDFGAHFSQRPLSGPDVHVGAICTLGVLCTGGRQLLDFTTAATEPKTGCPAYVYGGDSKGAGSAAAPYFVRQIGGPCLNSATPSSTGATQSGTTGLPQSPAPSLGLPRPRRGCLSRRLFRIHLRAPAGERLRSAAVFVRDHRVRVSRRSGRLTAIVDLRRAPRGRFSVRVSARTVSGRRVSERRTYRTCTPRRRAG